MQKKFILTQFAGNGLSFTAAFPIYKLRLIQSKFNLSAISDLIRVAPEPLSRIGLLLIKVSTCFKITGSIVEKMNNVK